MNNTTKVALLAVMLTTLVAGTQIASADDHTQEQDREAHQQIHEQVKAAVEAGDYEAFQTATANSPRAGEITEEQFQVLLEARELKDSGDTEGAKALLEEAGIQRPGHKHKTQGPKNPEAKAAVEAGDYAAFQAAIADGPRADVTENQFNTIVEAQSLRQAGDHEAARELLKEAGFERPQRGKFRAQN